MDGPPGHWMILWATVQGHHQATRLTPRPWPRTTPCRASLGSRRLAYRTDAGYQGVPVTSTGATGSSMTSQFAVPTPLSPAVGTDRHGMLHPPGRSHAPEAMAARLSGLLFLRRLPWTDYPARAGWDGSIRLCKSAMTARSEQTDSPRSGLVQCPPGMLQGHASFQRL